MADLDRRDGEPVSNADELDLAIATIRSENPTWPIRAITTKLRSLGFDVSKSTVHRRISKFSESDQIKLARKAFVTLLDQAFRKFGEHIKRGEYQALRDLLFGLGVLSHTQKVQTGDLPKDEEGLIDELDRYDTARLRKRRDELRRRRDPDGADRPALSADDRLEPGDDSSSDA